MNEKEFKKDLMRRQKKDCHLKFFREDKSLQGVTFPIFSKFGPKAQITPFRNSQCTKPSCVYALEDLMKTFEESNYSSMAGFICYSCDKFINMKDFFLDYTLSKIIDVVWEKYNKPDKILCKKITIMRDGVWEPNIPEHVKYLNKNIEKSLGINSKEERVRGYFSDEEEVQTIVNYEPPPHLNEFDKEKYKEMWKEFNEAGRSPNDVYFEKNGIPVTVEDIVKVEQEEGISSRIVTMFVDYLNTLQQTNKGKYNKGNNNRTYYTAVSVINYDRFYRKAKYQFFFGSINKFHNNPEKLYQEYDRLVIVFKHDERWMAAVVNFKNNHFYIADFLSSDLSKARMEEILDVVKSIATDEFRIRHCGHEFYDDYKIAFYCDCGMYILNFLYKVMANADVDMIRLQPREKELFRKQLVWLCLKMKTLKKQKVQMLPFPKEGHDPYENKLTARNLKKLEEEYSGVRQDPFTDRGVQVSLNQMGGNQPRQSRAISELPEGSILRGLKTPQQAHIPQKSVFDFNVPSSRPGSNAMNGMMPLTTKSVNLKSLSLDQSSVIEMKKEDLQKMLEDYKNEILGKVTKNSRPSTKSSSITNTTITSLPHLGPMAPQFRQPMNPYMQGQVPNPMMFMPPQMSLPEESSSDDSSSAGETKELINNISELKSVASSKVGPLLPGRKPVAKHRPEESLFEELPKSKLRGVNQDQLGKKKELLKQIINESSSEDSDSSHGASLLEAQLAKAKKKLQKKFRDDDD